MRARLVCLFLCALPRFGHGFSWENGPSATTAAPEPRSFASLSGSYNDSTVYLYGGFSHARNTWMSETWKLQLNGANAQWTKLTQGDLQHATIVNLGGEILLVGGRNTSGTINDKLYRLDKTWVAVPVQGNAVPRLYRHAAVSYTVAGSPRVLLCGGVDAATNETVNRVYELSYDATSALYVFTEMSPMPEPLFGLSLAAGNDDSKVYLSGGLSGKYSALPNATLPPQLAATISGLGGSSECPRPSARVLVFDRGAAEGNGSWTDLGSAARPVAFHSSWVSGSSLYMYGGVQGPADNNAITAWYPLQVVQLSGGDPPATGSYNLTAVQDALRDWNVVQPGSLSGSAIWLNASATNGGPAQARLWLFGGWATPQPLALAADAYISPQDGSLMWRLGGGAGANSSSPQSTAGRWLAPLQCGMAPRGAAGLMSVPVTVNGSRKLLVMGGRTAKGWTGATGGGSTSLSYVPEYLKALLLPPGNGPLDAALSYQLYDIWLIDQATGSRELVWDVGLNASGVLTTAAAAPQPYGTWSSPLAVGRLWDRRLLEFYPAGVQPGGGATAVYLHAEEVVASGGGSSTLQPGIWNLTLSVRRLEAADGTFSATIATWTSLLPAAAGSQDCYPRVLYGAAHLTSTSNTSNSTSYIAVHGGLTSNVASLWAEASSSICVLELAASGTTRWLRQPPWAEGLAPGARYRHACAARPGLPNYSMTCYGGVDGKSSKVLEDAWTLTMQSGVVYGDTQQFNGSWSQAIANYSAPRPGPRVDHWMIPLRGSVAISTNPAVSLNSSSQPAEANFSPVLVIGGSTSVADDAVALPPHQSIWLLDAASCADPDAADSGSTVQRDLKAQIWLSLLPNGGALRKVAAAAAQSTPPLTSWRLASAGLVKSQSASELWLLLGEAAPDASTSTAGVNAVGDVKMLRAVVNKTTGGCLSTSLRPWCGNLSYDITSVAAACLPGAKLKEPYPTVNLTGDNTTLSLFPSVSVFAILDPDGASVRYPVNPGRTPTQLDGVWVPPGLDFSNFTVIAYGRPYIELSRTNTLNDLTLSLPPAYKIMAKVMYLNGGPLINESMELRVWGPDGLFRKRRASASPSTPGSRSPDYGITNSNGTVGFMVMNTSVAAAVGGNVSYAIIFSHAGKSYSAVLQSPAEAAKTTGQVPGGGGVVSTLLPAAEADAMYDITIPPPSFSSDYMTSVAFIFQFKSLNSTAQPLYLPATRLWVMNLSYVLSESSEETKYTVQKSYNTPTAELSMQPGNYTLSMFDANMSTAELLPSPSSFSVPPSASRVVITLAVPMSAVVLSVNFTGLLTGGSPVPSNPMGMHVMADLYTLTTSAASGSSSGHISSSSRSSSSSSSGGDSSSARRRSSSIAAALESTMLVAGAFVAGGRSLGVSSSSSASGPAAATAVSQFWGKQVVDETPWALLPGVPYKAEFRLASGLDLGVKYFTAPYLDSQYASVNVALPQLLMCAYSTPNFLTGKKGRFPENPGSVVFFSGLNCTWRIITGDPAFVKINISQGSWTLRVFADGVESDISLGTGGIYTPLHKAAYNITIVFDHGGYDGVLNYFVIEWEAQVALSSMPPQFIMMIAASSAAAGAMLLFLCLWHCVFRPVQMRRQAAAAAAAAIAAGAANANGAHLAPGARSGANRNRVPRRYLRMMDTSVYSAKEAAAAKEAAVPAAVTAATAAPPVVRKDTAKVSNVTDVVVAETGSTVDVGAAAAAAAPPPPSQPASNGPASQSEAEAASGGEVCSICLCEFEDGDRIKYLPCKHFYHVACIDQWLGRDITCPLCKDDVLHALRSLYGPLPPRGGSLRQGRGGEDDAAVTAAGAATEVGSGGEGGIVQGAAGAGSGGGAATHASVASGADLEMVVIMSHVPGVGGGGSGGGGEGDHTGPLPGSVSSLQGTAAAADAVAGGGAGVGASTVLLVHASGGGGGTGTITTISSTTPRQLGPVRRNISTDLTAEHDETSTGSDSGDDSEYDTATQHPLLGSNAVPASASVPAAAAATGGSGASARASQNVSQSHGFRGQGAAPAGALGGGGIENQLATDIVPVALPLGSTGASPRGCSGGGASSYSETTGLTPSPRPVVEHVQRSPCSSGGGNGPAMRWISGGSSQVPRPVALAAGGGVTMHRLARAQEAQMAVVAAALSAAAAGVNNGGGGGGGGSGANSWRAASTTSVSCAGVPSPSAAPASPSYLDGNGAGSGTAAAAAVLSYRMHNNPLAAGSTSSRSASIGSPRAADRLSPSPLACTAVAATADHLSESFSLATSTPAAAAAANVPP